MKTTPQLIDAANELLQHGTALQDFNRSQNQTDYALDIYLRHLGAAVRYATALSASADIGEVGQLLSKAGSKSPLRDTSSPKAKLFIGQQSNETESAAAFVSPEELQLINEKYLAQVKSMPLEEVEVYFTEAGLVQLIKQINQTAANPLTFDSGASKATLSKLVYDHFQSIGRQSL